MTSDDTKPKTSASGSNDSSGQNNSNNSNINNNNNNSSSSSSNGGGRGRGGRGRGGGRGGGRGRGRGRGSSGRGTKNKSGGRGGDNHGEAQKGGGGTPPSPSAGGNDQNRATSADPNKPQQQQQQQHQQQQSADSKKGGKNNNKNNNNRNDGPGGRGGRGSGRGGRGSGRGGRGGKDFGSTKTDKNEDSSKNTPGSSEKQNDDGNKNPKKKKPNNKKGKGGNEDKKDAEKSNKDTQDSKNNDNDNDNTNKNKNNENKNAKKNNNNNNNKKKQGKKDTAEHEKKGKAGNQKESGSGEGKNKEKRNNNNNKTKKGPAGSGVSKPAIPPNQPQQTSDINYGKGEHIVVLHVGEKPSIAEAIAKGLCNGERGFHKKVMPVHTFTNPSFPKAPHAKKVTHKVTSVAGHVFSVDFPQEFQSWESVDPGELFHAPIKRKPCKGSVVSHLQNEAKGVDFIVLWMDCDREGENINFEVLDCCMHCMKGGGGVAHYDRVYRAYFSAINPSDIMKAYNALGKPDKNQALAVDARQELDLKVGVAFSRFQTRFFQGRYGDLDSSVLSYGPCQTPTMGFVVQRHVDIETFKPEPFWVLELGILKRGRRLRALWESGRSFNKAKTEALVEKALEANATAVVSNVVTRDKKQGRPIPMNTVALLKACSKALGIGPHQAMQCAERLYLSGYLSYPRTESTAYPNSFDIRGTLQQQAGDSRWGAYVKELLATGHTKSRGGVDMGDHPPITPMRAAGSYELSGDMSRVFELVVRHFIASVSPDAVWRSTKVTFEIEALGEKGKFYLAGKELVSPGFLKILLHKEYGDDGDKDDDDDEEEVCTLPEFRKGEVIKIFNKKSDASSSAKVNVVASSAVWASLDVKEKMTTAPGYLTESELIGMMEKHGIGTDASIPTHIENIQKRNYVRLETGRRLLPNKLGLVLCQGYHQIDSGLVLPKVRADIEGQCNKISTGDLEKEVVIQRAIQIFEEKFHFFVSNIGRMDLLFGSSFSKLEDVGKPFTRCGISRRYLSYIPGPPPRLYNKFTETVYPLPVGGEIKQWSGRKCNVEGCNFELCLYSVGAPPRTFPLCPNCFNKPEWSMENPNDNEDDEDREDQHKEQQIGRVAGKNLTLSCPLPDHHPLIDDLFVSPDPDSDGIFTLDPHFGPKWRLVGTRDATIIHLPKCIDSLVVLEEKDEIFGCHKLKIKFKEGESPLEDGATKHVCFYPTDQLLQDSSRVYHGSERTASSGRGGRGRGRGGRGRGRGRGGGRGRR